MVWRPGYRAPAWTAMPSCSIAWRPGRSPGMSAGISAVDHGGNVGALDPQIEQLTVGASLKLAGDPGALAPLSAPCGERSCGFLEQVQHEHLRMLECDVGGSRHRSEF